MILCITETGDGRAFRALNILGEHSRERLAIRVERELNSTVVIAEAVRGWVKAVNTIKPGSRVALGERILRKFGSLRDELLNEEFFDTLDDARRKLSLWRYDYNNVRPHSSLGNQTPAEARRGLSNLSAPRTTIAQTDDGEY